MNSHSPDLKQLRQWLLDANESAILELARKRKSILSQLTALTYDPDLTVNTRTIEVTGLAVKIIAERDPDYVRNYLLRLFWLVNDESGGICWRAPELIGEILHNCPQYEQFFPLLISLLDMEKEDAPRFRVGIVIAIGRAAQVTREGMSPSLEQVRAFESNDPDMEVREAALWCLSQFNGNGSLSKNSS